MSGGNRQNNWGFLLAWLTSCNTAVRQQSARWSNKLLIESSLSWGWMGLLSNTGNVIEGFSSSFSALSDSITLQMRAGWACWGMESCPFYLCKAILKIASSKIRLKPPVLICRLLLGLLKAKDPQFSLTNDFQPFLKGLLIHQSLHRPPAHKDPLSPLTIFTGLLRTHAFSFPWRLLLIAICVCRCFVLFFSFVCALSEVPFKKLYCLGTRS